MNVDEAIDHAINAAEHYKATGVMPKWATMAMVDLLTNHADVLRAHIERKVDVTHEMVRVALVRYLGIESPYTRDVAMREALIAALGVEDRLEGINQYRGNPESPPCT
jgi:hypothetical protein